MRQRILAMLLSACMSVASFFGVDLGQKAIMPAESEKPRTVITTDGEVDDMNSVLRFMLYANEMDLAGIVLTSSTYHYAGDAEAGIEPFRWTGTEWLNTFIDAYAEVYPNLSIHADGYPAPEYLRSIYKIGNISNVGEMEKVTEGSEFLKDLFLDDDPRPLYVQTWGGTNTTARALKSIEEQYKGTDQWEAIQQKVYDKLVVYIILDQDDSYSNYIATNWPGLKVLNDRSNFWYFAYIWQFNPTELTTRLQAKWLLPHIRENNGPLLDQYALIGDGRVLPGELEEEQRGIDLYLQNNPNYNRYDFISEGDSPSFFYLLSNGLRSLDDPAYGGWGGRFAAVNENTWNNTALDFNPYTNRYEAEYTLTRWFDDIQNDFAARADWCVAASYEDANHAPVALVKEGIELTAKPGQSITLHALASDPDGDAITYRWWHYFEADTYEESKVEKNPVQTVEMSGMLISTYRELAEGEVTDNIPLSGADTSTMSFTVPEDAQPGDTLHMILEVQDDGDYNLKCYQRVVITIQ